MNRDEIPQEHPIPGPGDESKFQKIPIRPAPRAKMSDAIELQSDVTTTTRHGKVPMGPRSSKDSDSGTEVGEFPEIRDEQSQANVVEEVMQPFAENKPHVSTTTKALGPSRTIFHRTVVLVISSVIGFGVVAGGLLFVALMGPVNQTKSPDVAMQKDGETTPSISAGKPPDSGEGRHPIASSHEAPKWWSDDLELAVALTGARIPSYRVILAELRSDDEAQRSACYAKLFANVRSEELTRDQYALLSNIMAAAYALEPAESCSVMIRDELIATAGGTGKEVSKSVQPGKVTLWAGDTIVAALVDDELPQKRGNLLASAFEQSFGTKLDRDTPTRLASQVLTTLSGVSSETRKLIFLTNGDDPFWDALLSGLKEGEKQFGCEEAGLVVSRDVNNGTAEGQIEKLRQYATQDEIAAVAISVIQADNQTIADEMKNLQEKGMKVITVDGDVNRENFRDARTYYIGTDNIVGGQTLGTATKALLEAKGVKTGGYVQFAGFTDNDNARSRMNGVKETIGEAYTERDRMADYMDMLRARNHVRNAIQNHKDLVALIGIWAYNAPAIADVVTESKTRDKFLVGTFDAQDLAIGHMAKGNIDVMVVQNPFDMGVQTVRLLKAIIENDEAVENEMFPNVDNLDGDIFTTGVRVVVPDERSPVKAEMFDPRDVEYMTLRNFQAWLSRHGLTSS